MLVLSRTVSETIKIGENVTVTVIRTSRGSVTLGIQAPRDIPVVRIKSNPAEQIPGEAERV